LKGNYRSISFKGGSYISETLLKDASVLVA